MSQAFEEFKTITSAVLRTIAGNKEIEPTYSVGEAPIGTVGSLTNPRLPLPEHSMSPESVRLVRGCADANALKIAYHNQNLHSSEAPQDSRAKAAFEALEQARCEALGMNAMRGVAQNLGAVMAEKCRRKGYGEAAEREQIPLPDALHILARQAITAQPPSPAEQHVMDLWQPFLADKLGSDGLGSLKNALHDQSQFAKIARALIRDLDMPAPEQDAEIDQPNRDKDGGNEPDDNPEPEDKNDEAGQQQDQQDQALQNSADEEMNDGSDEFDAGYDEILDDMLADDMQSGETPAENMPFRPESLIHGPEGQYRIYTTEFDEEISAAELADPDEIRRLRELLDKQLSHHQAIITKLANRLQRKLMARQMRTWQFDMEEGILDTARIARIIANPNVPLTYKAEKDMPFRDTVVSILIDNSGSMRGRPIAIAAMTTDIIAKTLERCGVKVEILGFTTRAWKGGSARELWMQNGRPDMPGRLNDIRHIIYKGADEPWRRTHKNLGLMLKEGLLKENIDGEALVWAYNRLAARGEARKIMIVISDGAPVDDSTLSVNPSNILEQDLRNVINWIENKTKIELTAIGIGHDVTRYYNKALTIADADALAQALVGQLADLFEEN
ncbi:MAG: cobaltochelatase subunit CobT [Micavibrio sp.]|nr:cobaltochelatase subunit CobT [Micavibrio sp.]|tara:strand:- start:1996 stop:3843 length:1848 start_codon:yes stop_codon:yes gene_type:complete